MADLENGIPNSEPASTNVQQETSVYEDEIKLMDSFLVLWKRKYLILLCSVLPVFIAVLILFSLPGNYTITYTYDVNTWNLNENHYRILLDHFYSAENTNKIEAKWQEYNPKAVNLGVWPSYIDLSRVNITDAGELKQIRQLKAQLLNVAIVGRPENDIRITASVIRDNFENVIPLYTVENQLSSTTRICRDKMAGIEENKFNLELALKSNNTILAKLKNIKTKISDKSENNIALQFDISGKTEYLPVEFQIQAFESKTAQLEERIAANEETYKHYKGLLALNENLFTELKKKTSSYYTIQQYRLHLIGLIDSYTNENLNDYLSSYIKRIENRISSGATVTQEPKVYPVAKGTVRKSVIVFAAALMCSVFASFLLEGIQKAGSRLHRS